MNRFNDCAIITSVRSHGESGAIVSCLTQNHGRTTAYVAAAQSSQKLRSTLQIGNQVSVEWQSKNNNDLGFFSIEPEYDISAIIMDNPTALLAIQSICGMMTMFLPDREPHTGIYHGTVAFLNFIKSDDWLPLYVMWEMSFLKELGYGIDITKCAVTGTSDNLTHVSPKSGRAVCSDHAMPYKDKLLEIPQFLLGNGVAENDIAKGFALTGYFLMHRVLQQSTFQHLPEARTKLENVVCEIKNSG